MLEKGDFSPEGIARAIFWWTLGGGRSTDLVIYSHDFDFILLPVQYCTAASADSGGHGFWSGVTILPFVAYLWAPGTQLLSLSLQQMSISTQCLAVSLPRKTCCLMACILHWGPLITTICLKIYVLKRKTTGAKWPHLSMTLHLDLKPHLTAVSTFPRNTVLFNQYGIFGSSSRKVICYMNPLCHPPKKRGTLHGKTIVIPSLPKDVPA